MKWFYMFRRFMPNVFLFLLLTKERFKKFGKADILKNRPLPLENTRKDNCKKTEG